MSSNHRTRRTAVALAVLAAAAVAVAPTASASPTLRDPDRPTLQREQARIDRSRGEHRRAVRSLLVAAAQVLDMSPQDLARALADGATPAEVAAERGVGRDALLDALVAQARERIEARADRRPGLDVERATARATQRLEAWVDNGARRR